jgi:hypothetical protein
VREASGLDTTKAILTAIIAGVVVFIITAVLTSIAALLGIGTGAVAVPQ